VAAAGRSVVRFAVSALAVVACPQGVLKQQRRQQRAARVALVGAVDDAAFKKEPPFSVREVKNLMHQLLSAMEYMHRCWFLHRDLKVWTSRFGPQGLR
jgi:serine/threonine protein kinase